MPLEVKDIFEATSRNVREMLSERGLGLYIPPYQRPYGWDKEKVQKLVEDVLHGYAQLIDDTDSFTFLGTVITIHDINNTTIQPIVRSDVPSRVLTVIDGQQRLTTLLTFCVALHNRIQLAHNAMLKGRPADKLTFAEDWLHAQALQTVESLAATFFERHPHPSAPPYPRMIRAFSDQWARTAQNAQYVSPIAYLLSTYVATIPVSNQTSTDPKPTEFKPKGREGQIEGEQALVGCFTEMVKLLKRVAQDERDEDDEDVPSLAKITSRDGFQRALLGHEMPAEFVELLRSEDATKHHKSLIRLVLIAQYFLTRVAVTMVRGKNEHYAFTVFESLNTTGEPLTAFETFVPRVVSAESLEHYESSASRKNMEEVSRYLSSFDVGEKLQNATRDLLIYFASAETGAKLSKRLADQRRYLKDEFDRYQEDALERSAFVANLRDVAHFIDGSEWKSSKDPALTGLPPDATSDIVKMCLAFLRDFNHSVTIAPLSRFYAKAVAATNEADRKKAISDFEGALKAMCAFSALWRASRRGTANIDTEYRDLMLGVAIDSEPSRPPLARSRRREGGENQPEPVVDVDQLKQQLRERLSHPKRGGVDGRDAFIEAGLRVPSFTNNKSISRFILLAAYHDSIEDPTSPGMILKGKSAVAPCLTYSGYIDHRHLTLEHIAPQRETVGWAKDIWAEPEMPHSIGNLVLTPAAANSSLSNRPWAEKRVMYAALSSPSAPEAEKVFNASGIDFGENTQELAKSAAFMPHLAAVSKAGGEWSADMIRRRSECLLGLSWDELYPWLK